MRTIWCNSKTNGIVRNEETISSFYFARKDFRVFFYPEKRKTTGDRSRGLIFQYYPNVTTGPVPEWFSRGVCMNVNKKTSTIAKLGVLGAISIVLVALIHISIFPAVPFLEYDPADIPILLATFAMGPWAGLALTVVVAVIQGLTVSAASGWYGIVMHIISTGAYVIIAGEIYKHKKTKKGAILALCMGTLSRPLVMIPANLILTPLYMGVPRSVVVDILWWIIAFNIVYAAINSLITFFVYKRVSPILHK